MEEKIMIHSNNILENQEFNEIIRTTCVLIERVIFYIKATTNFYL